MNGMKVVKGLIVPVLWFVCLPVLAWIGISVAWGEGGIDIDNSPTPSTAASLGGWAVFLLGVALLSVVSWLIIREPKQDDTPPHPVS